MTASEHPDPDADDLYQQFVDRYLRDGTTAIDPSWPEDVCRRCRLFLLLHESRSVRLASQSLLGALADEGLFDHLTLGATATDAPPATGADAAIDAAAASAGPARDGDAEERYVVESELGRGGMGRVLLTYDRDLRREIAMKVLLDQSLAPSKVARFLEEAQTTAQLEHPNIAPVYDLGVDETGAPFFTMKRIRGRDLEDILQRRDDGNAQEFSFLRLIQILQQVAMGIDFAHSRGVVHRDLKPQNIMVGDYGEVLVVDWGLAKVFGRASADGEESGRGDAVTTDRREMGAVSQAGGIVGSLSYMAPEQACGDVAAIGAHTDVFGLGGILYAILTRSPPYGGSSLGELLNAAQQARVEPPQERAPHADIPDDLSVACLHALSLRPEDRFATAREFHDALQSWVEGVHDRERREKEARELLERADEDLDTLRVSEKSLHELGESVEALREEIDEHAPIERKQPLWECLYDEDCGREDVASAFQRATASYQAVLSIDPTNRGARAALAALYFERMVDAETRGDADAVSIYEGLVRQHDTGLHAASLQREGDLEIDSEPPADRIVLLRYRERGPLLVESDREVIDGPTLRRRLPMGSYLAVFEKAGHEPARLPILVGRGATSCGRATLHREGSIPRGFLQIAGGESIVGSVQDDLPSFERAARSVDEFFMARFPVTLEDYAAFLDARAHGVVAASSENLADADLLPSFGTQQYLVQDADGRFVPNEKAGLDPRTPVMGLPRRAMLAFCAWRSNELGREVRLPTELEWERAARGADGRTYPWGNGFDWALCKGGRSRAGQPAPEAAGSFASDASPFGVSDLGGSIRELCGGWFEEEYSPCRGGSWFQNGPPVFRCASRTMLRDGARTTDVGFRVCFSSRNR